MAQVIEITSFPSLSTPTAKLFADGSDTVVATGSVTSASNRQSIYSCSFTGIPVGVYLLILYSGGVAYASRFVTIDAANGIWTEYLPQGSVSVASISTGVITDASFSLSSQARKTFAMLGGKSVWDNSAKTTTYYAADGSTIVFTDARSEDGSTVTRTVV